MSSLADYNLKTQGNTTITLIEDNEHFLIVDKPINISVQDDKNEPGLISALKLQTGIDSLHPVHRLDRVTSGLLIVAKNSLINKEISNSFEKREVEKYYLAISRSKSGLKVKKKQGKIVGDMCSARNGSYMLARTVKNPACTQFFSAGMGDRYRLSIIKPKTGKTHQIRVALKSVSMPILGDKRYGGEDSDRTYLHAFQLNFQCLGIQYSFKSFPSTGSMFNDERFKAAFERLTEDSYGETEGKIGCKRGGDQSPLAWSF